MSAEVEAGRVHVAARKWRDAYDCLAPSATDPEDLERLATSAFLIGRVDEYFGALERAHRGYLERAAVIDAARCAGWIGLMRMQSGDIGQGTGWIARAARLVEDHGADCVETGYLRFPQMFGHQAAGELEAALQVAGDAAAIGRRYADPDLIALAVHSEGQYLIGLGRTAPGLAKLDEAMVAVTADELSPIVNGIVYCGVILACRAAYDLGRATEWTQAMRRWCDAQPDMLSFTGLCCVHRAEILGLHGSWQEALSEIDAISADGIDPGSRGEAAYLRADVFRMQGRFDDAEAAYRLAKADGREPQPGLALLRLARGSVEAASTMISLALREVRDLPGRPPLLAAAVEILLAAGDVDAASQASAELSELAAANPSRLLSAMAAQGAGRVALARTDAESAVSALRLASSAWQHLAAPYELARTRLLIGQALLELGDKETAELEFEAAGSSLTELGAMPEQAALDALRGGGRQVSGLTPREIEVLQLVASGATNRAIAATLVLSERTVDRHVSNIFAKIGVSSRTAAAAFALERKLI